MSKDEIIKQTISNYRKECSELPNDMDFTDKLQKHEEILIKTILETVLNNT